jgi:hypothetical protein
MQLVTQPLRVTSDLRLGLPSQRTKVGMDYGEENPWIGKDILYSKK